MTTTIMQTTVAFSDLTDDYDRRGYPEPIEPALEMGLRAQYSYPTDIGRRAVAGARSLADRATWALDVLDIRRIDSGESMYRDYDTAVVVRLAGAGDESLSGREATMATTIVVHTTGSGRIEPGGGLYADEFATTELVVVGSDGSTTTFVGQPMDYLPLRGIMASIRRRVLDHLAMVRIAELEAAVPVSVVMPEQDRARMFVVGIMAWPSTVEAIADLGIPYIGEHFWLAQGVPMPHPSTPVAIVSVVDGTASTIVDLSGRSLPGEVLTAIEAVA